MEKEQVKSQENVNKKSTEEVTKVNVADMEIKPLRELSKDEIKQLSKVKTTFYQTTNKDNTRTTYSAKVHLVEGYCDVRVELSQADYYLEMLKIRQDINYSKAVTNVNAFVRYVRGLNRYEEMCHMVGVIFNDSLRKVILLNDNQVELLKRMGKYDLINWLDKDGLEEENLIMPMEFE